MKTLQATQLAARLAAAEAARPVLLDVREPWEFALCHIDGSVNVPMSSVPARETEFDPDAEIVVICHHGIRSAQVCMFLERQGFTDLSNLVGGVAAWADEVEPTMTRY